MYQALITSLITETSDVVYGVSSILIESIAIIITYLLLASPLVVDEPTFNSVV